jgi:hypothetical protein
MLAGIFGIVLGGLILLQVCLVLALKFKRDAIVADNIEWLPTRMKSRGIILTKHEKCEFPYISVFEDKQLTMLGLGKGKKKKNQIEEESEEDEYDFDDQDEMDYQIVDRVEESHHMPLGGRDRNDPMSKTNNSHFSEGDQQESYRGNKRGRN